jgi:hypothetical protein
MNDINGNDIPDEMLEGIILNAESNGGNKTTGDSSAFSRSDLEGPNGGNEGRFISDFNARHGHGTSLELRIISFLRDDRIRQTFVAHLDPADIVEDVSRLAFEAIREVNTSDLALLDSSLQKRIKDPEILRDVMRAFSSVKVPLAEHDCAYTQRLINNYVRLRKVASPLSYLQELDLGQMLSLDQEFYNRVQSACAFDVAAGTNGDQSLYRFSTTEDVLRAKEKSNPTGTSIPSSFGLVNECLPGGFAAGTVTMVVAPPGVGKSTFLAGEAVAAAKNGYNVYLVVLGDLRPFDVWVRCASIYSRLPMNRIVRDWEALHGDAGLRDLFEKIQLKCVGAYELTAGDIYTDALARKNKFDFDLILVDYDGNIKSKEGTLYQEGGHVYGKFDQIAKHTNTALITACQPKQEWWDKEVLTLKSAGESSKKQHVADLIVTLSRPSAVPVGTLHIAKARRGRSGHSRYVAYAGRYARILEISSQEQLTVETFYRDTRCADEGDDRFNQWASAKLGTEIVSELQIDGGRENDQ